MGKDKQKCGKLKDSKAIHLLSDICWVAHVSLTQFGGNSDHYVLTPRLKHSTVRASQSVTPVEKVLQSLHASWEIRAGCVHKTLEG